MYACGAGESQRTRIKKKKTRKGGRKPLFLRPVFRVTVYGTRPSSSLLTCAVFLLFIGRGARRNIYAAFVYGRQGAATFPFPFVRCVRTVEQYVRVIIITLAVRSSLLLFLHALRARICVITPFFFFFFLYFFTRRYCVPVYPRG